LFEAPVFKAHVLKNKHGKYLSSTSDSYLVHASTLDTMNKWQPANQQSFKTFKLSVTVTRE